MDRIRSDHGFADARAVGGAPVRFDRPLALRTLLLAALLLWPLILFGRPAYVADSAAYIKGGKVAVAFVSELLQPAAAPAADSENAAVGETDVASPRSEAAGVKGARSIPYSVMAYLLRGPGFDMIWLALAQTALAAFTCAVAATAAGIRSWKAYAILGLAMAAASSLPTFTSFMLPDVFAGIVSAALLLLFLFFERLSQGVRLALAGIASFAVTLHASIVPLVFWLCVAGSVYALWERRSMMQPVARLAWLWAPMVLGGLVTVAAGFVAFGEASVVAKHYPHALARSVSDGPARWYLQEECRVPRYAVCEVFGTNIPSTVSGFLFNDTGLDGRATPEQMDRIRAEESDIVFRAALAYPGTELGNLARNVTKQFVSIVIWRERFGDEIRSDASGNPEFVEMPDRISPALTVLNIAVYVVMLFCLFWAGRNFRRLDRRQQAALVLIVSVLVVNTAFCVLASGISYRYQARLAWIVPLFVLSFALARRETSLFPAGKSHKVAIAGAAAADGS